MEIAGFEDNTSDGRQPNQPRRARRARPPTPSLGRRMYQKGLQTFVWKADDQNDDRLQYDVFYRREGETTWKVLKRGLWDPIFVWDTTSVPDGTYVVKIAASDAPSNSPGTALVGELESVSFDIDNTPPRIEISRRGARRARTVGVRRSATNSPPFSASSIRSTPAAGAWSTRRTASPTRAARSSRSTLDEESEKRPQRDHPRHRRDEQRRDDRGR